MDALFRASGRASRALAWLTMAALGVLVLLVSTDVLLRASGFKPLAWGTSVAEYILLYACFLPMPALVRGKGHVFVEFMRGPMPPWMKLAAERLVYVTCLGLSAFLAFVALQHLVLAVQTGAYETRSFDAPTWVLYLPMAIGFALSTLEWLRFLFGADSIYAVDPLTMDGY